MTHVRRGKIDRDILHEVLTLRCEVAVLSQRVEVIHETLLMLATTAPQAVLDRIHELTRDTIRRSGAMQAVIDANQPPDTKRPE